MRTYTTFLPVTSDQPPFLAVPMTPQDAFEKAHGVKLGFMSPFIKAAASALSEIPAVNAVIDGGDVSDNCGGCSVEYGAASTAHRRCRR